MPEGTLRHHDPKSGRLTVLSAGIPWDVDGFELPPDGRHLAFVTNEDDVSVSFIPKVVEHGYHAERLKSLTGLVAGENQARRMLNDIQSYAAHLHTESGRSVPFNVAAVRWLDQVFEPTIALIPTELFDRLEPAEIFHQLLEHRYPMAEKRGGEVRNEDALADYLAGVLPSVLIDTISPAAADFVGGRMPTQADVAWLSIAPIAETPSTSHSSHGRKMVQSR